MTAEAVGLQHKLVVKPSLGLDLTQVERLECKRND
jgi:hypothetical protein